MHIQILTPKSQFIANFRWMIFIQLIVEWGGGVSVLPSLGIRVGFLAAIKEWGRFRAGAHLLPTRGGKKRPLQKKLSEISKSFGIEEQKKVSIINRFRVKKKGPDAIKLLRPTHPRPHRACKSFWGAGTEMEKAWNIAQMNILAKRNSTKNAYFATYCNLCQNSVNSPESNQFAKYSFIY